VAKDWAEKLVHDLNEHMRELDVKEAEARIAYLEGKLQETTIAGMQQVFYQLIESETRTVMLANAQDEYIFKTVDPAVVPQEKRTQTRPDRDSRHHAGRHAGHFSVFINTFIQNGKKQAE